MFCNELVFEEEEMLRRICLLPLQLLSKHGKSFFNDDFLGEWSHPSRAFLSPSSFSLELFTSSFLDFSSTCLLIFHKLIDSLATISQQLLTTTTPQLPLQYKTRDCVYVLNRHTVVLLLPRKIHRSRPGPQKGRRKQQLTFDFVVAERPIYIPGSGPPLAPVTVMPLHDKDGIIKGEVKMDHQLMFIVSYEDHPYLRVSVKPQNILDWVSPRTFEEWEAAKTEAEIQAERDELLPKIQAREKKQLLKQQGRSASRAAEGPKKTWSRKRKRPPSPEPAPRPGRKRRGVDTEEEEAAIPNPRRPSLSTPTKQRGLAQPVDLDSEEEDEEEDSLAEDAAELIDRQLNGTLGRSKLANEVFRSPTTSPEPQPKKTLQAKKPPVPPFDRRETRSGSISSTLRGRGRETRSSSISRPPSRQDAVAAISSRHANAIYEKLQRKSQTKASSLTDKFSYSGKPPTSSQRQAAANPTRHKSETPKRKKSATPQPVEEEEEDDDDDEEDEDDEPEYEVDAILADEIRMDKKQNPVLYYLIKWVGEWANTWEPAKNVGTDAIKEYEMKKAAEQKRMQQPSMLKRTTKTKSGYDEDMEETSDDVIGIDPKGKGKQKISFGSSSRENLKGKGKGKATSAFRAGGFDGTEEESEEDSLFVKDRGQSRVKLWSKNEAR